MKSESVRVAILRDAARSQACAGCVYLPAWPLLRMTLPIGGRLLIQRWIAWAIAARFVLDENLGDLRVPDWLGGIGRRQTLLRDVLNEIRFRILGEQMIERLILLRPDLLGDRQPPFLGIVEDRIDIEDHAPERKDPVTDDLPDLKLGGPRFYHGSSNRP